MKILLMIIACVGFGTAALPLLLMADGRRLRERMFEPRPSLRPEEAEPETPLIRSDYAL